MRYEDFKMSPEQAAKNKRECDIIETARKYKISAAEIVRNYAAPWEVDDDIEDLKRQNIISACDNYGINADDLERLYREDSCDCCGDCHCSHCDHCDDQHHQHPQQPQQPVVKERTCGDPLITNGSFGELPALPDILKQHYMQEFENNKKIAEVAGKVTQALTSVILDYITEAGCYRSNNTLKSMCEIIDD